MVAKDDLALTRRKINLIRAQIRLERKNLKEAVRKYILLDYRHDLEDQYEKSPNPIISRAIDCLTFLLEE